MRLEQVDLRTWEQALPATGFEVFHTPEALEVLDRHADGELRLYAAYKGEAVVGLCPVFVRERALGRTVFSPPPSAGADRLGPLVTTDSPKRRKRERANGRLVELVLDAVDARSPRTLVWIQCPVSYADPRPFKWSDLDVDTRFTYVLDLQGTTPDDVLAGFNRDLRGDVKEGLDLDVTVSVEGVEAAMRIYDDVDERYGEYDERIPLSRSLYADLVEALGDRCRVYVVRDADGGYLGGATILYSNDVAMFWQGGVAASYEGTSVNGVLHWAVITDVLEDPALDSIAGYDLVGANDPRLAEYKAQFGGDLLPQYTVDSGGVGMAVAKRAYRMLAK